MGHFSEVVRRIYALGVSPSVLYSPFSLRGYFFANRASGHCISSGGAELNTHRKRVIFAEY